MKSIKYPELSSADWLNEQYLAQKKSANQISRELGCSPPSVRKAIIRHNIPIRTWRTRRALMTNGDCSVDNYSAATTHSINRRLETEWHPSKNGLAQLDNFGLFSPARAWWICKKSHEWEASIRQRSRGSVCPFCLGRRATPEYNLRKIRPEVAKWWHQTLNGDLAPEDVTPHSRRVVVWNCPNGKKEPHIWRVSVERMTRRSIPGCPFCDGRRVCLDNSLEMRFPDIASEWHPTGNGEKTPSDFSYASGYVAIWLCPYGTIQSPHKWRSQIAQRTVGGHGCPKCNSQTSRHELFVYSQIKYVFPNAKHNIKIEGMQIDIFIDDLNLVIEVDGYRHLGRESNDLIKNTKLAERGLRVLRVRDVNLKKIGDSDVFVNLGQRIFSFEDCKTIMKVLIDIVSRSKYIHRILQYLQLEAPPNISLYHALKKEFWRGSNKNKDAPAEPSHHEIDGVWDGRL